MLPRLLSTNLSKWSVLGPLLYPDDEQISLDLLTFSEYVSGEWGSQERPSGNEGYNSNIFIVIELLLEKKVFSKIIIVK